MKIDDQTKIQHLSYALGLAIGALETINAVPYDFNKDGLVNVLKRLKLMAEPTIFFVDMCENGAEEGKK
jgi:hypothetical protein